MTITDIKSLTSITITPEQAASVIGCSAQNIRVAAAQRPELLGFPVIRVGTRTKIPRVPFIKFLEGK